LSFLAGALTPAERRQTTIVFDAAAAPPGLARAYCVHGMTVLFASDHASADELLEELIAADHAPRQMVVVSSDRQVQRAARRRRATAVDSRVWYADLVKRQSSRHKRRGRQSEQFDLKPEGALSPGEVAAWMEMFGFTAVEASSIDQPPLTLPRRKRAARKGQAGSAAPEPHALRQPPRRKQRAANKLPRKPSALETGTLENPFPPGYGEDLLES
jgi:predicted RNA-binding protein with PIN domain